MGVYNDSLDDSIFFRKQRQPSQIYLESYAWQSVMRKQKNMTQDIGYKNNGELNERKINN
jgi:hypothetical protein